ncbi:MAG TPA: antitoxin family protein [Gemmataceae bacterium]|jgi:predicted DNA-binding antitoxin AbrB/MazE fold protein|nr:antitoxin family protein [Gemmataceae bacterium]
MTTRFSAVFENGLLRPTEPVSFAEGVLVELIVIKTDEVAIPPIPAQTLAEIAALPIELDGEAFSGRDHDRVLYGERHIP